MTPTRARRLTLGYAALAAAFGALAWPSLRSLEFGRIFAFAFGPLGAIGFGAAAIAIGAHAALYHRPRGRRAATLAGVSLWVSVTTVLAALATFTAIVAPAHTVSTGSWGAAPSTPSPTATANSSAYTITISWSAVGGATSYDIQRQVSGGGFSSLVTNLNAVTYDNTSLSGGTLYGYQVRACTGASCSSWSSTTSATTIPAVPSAPTPTAAYRSVSVAWSSVTGATSYDLQSNVSGGSYSTLQSNATSPYADNGNTAGLADNTLYGYKVRACNATGCSAYSSAATTTTSPAIPTLSGSVSLTGSSLSWTAPSGTSTYTLNTSGAGSVSSQTDTFNRANSSSSLGTMSDSSATWNVVSGTWGILSNQAYVATNAGPSFATIDPGSPNGFVQFTRAVDGENYQGMVFRYVDQNNYWYIFAAYGFGTWGIYKVVNGVTTQVTNLGATFTAAGQVVRVEFDGNTIRGYTDSVLRQTITDAALSGATKVGLYAGAGLTSASRWEDFSTGQLGAITSPVTGLTSTTYTGSSLFTNAQYTYTVQACNASACSTASNSVVGYTQENAAALVATVASSTQIDLAWTRSGRYSGQLYDVDYRSPPGSGGWTSVLSGSANISTSKSSLTAATDYEFRVRACMWALSCLAYSPYTTVIATTTATAVPSAPTAVVGDAGYREVAVSWTAPSSGNVTNYRVHAFQGASEVSGSPKTVGSNQTTYEYPGLAASTAYAFKVDATNSQGNSSSSTASSAITTNADSAERIAPDAILASTNYSNPQVSQIQDDPDNYQDPDTTGIIATSASTLSQMRVSFPTPAGPLVGTSTNQQFKVYLKKRNASGTANAGVRLRLYENGSLVSSDSGTTVGSATGPFFYNWNPTTLSDSSGAGVELMIDQTSGTNATIDVYAVEWNAVDTPAFATPNAPTSPTASAGSGEITVGWTAPSAVTARVKNYRVTVYSSSGGDPVAILDWSSQTRTLNSTSVSYIFNGLRAGTQYTFKIQAYNAAGWGTTSAATSATAPTS